MIGVYLPMATLLLVALLFGGMFLFSVAFAAFLFRHLPQQDACMLIRKAFPPFYLFVIISSGLVMALSWRSDPFSSALMAFVMFTAVAARQLLMPAINHATDMALRKRFVLLHSLSVVLTLIHIFLAGMILVHLVK
jgi:hypothetical protein